MRRTAAAILPVVLLLTAGCGATSGGSESGGKVGKTDVTVQATKILKEFENNEATADGRYKNKTVQVSGVVDKVDTDFLDDEKYVVRVGGGGQFEITTVNCNGLTSKQVSKIKKGDDITVVGAFDDGGDLGVELTPCQLK